MSRRTPDEFDHDRPAFAVLHPARQPDETTLTAMMIIYYHVHSSRFRCCCEGECYFCAAL